MWTGKVKWVFPAVDGLSFSATYFIEDGNDTITFTHEGFPSLEAIADSYIARNVAGGSSTGRTVKQALAAQRNKVEIAAGTLTVYDTDDTTPLCDAAVTTAAGNPISAVDPS